MKKQDNIRGIELKYREPVWKLILVSLPTEGRVKEVVVRHPMCFDYRSCSFKEIDMTDEIIKLLKDEL